MGSLAEPEVFARVSEILLDVKKLKREITREDDIRQLGLDSLDVINYLFGIEEKFGVNLPLETVEDKELFLVGAMVDHLCGKS
jgi:acyl carrier protein